MAAAAARVRLSHRCGLRMFLALLMTVAAASAGAQEFRATMTGRVADEQGAVLPGVTVTVTNVDTNVSLTAVTNESGVYTVTPLQPGTYRIAAALTGFKTFVREAIVLRTAETGTVNIQLQLGHVEETVTVVGGLTAVESNQSTLAQTMENKRVSELPLNGRQVYMLLQLTAGTFFTQTTFGSTGFSGTRAWDTNGNISIQSRDSAATLRTCRRSCRIRSPASCPGRSSTTTRFSAASSCGHIRNFRGLRWTA